jgi:uncharacterized membrane protein YfcA
MKAPQTPAVQEATLLPTAGQVARAGVSGAAIAGAWTGVNEAIRARNGEMTTDEAIRTTVNSAAIGAGAGAVAQIASHVARALPPFGLAVVAIGVAALYFANQRKPEAPRDDAKPNGATGRIAVKGGET